VRCELSQRASSIGFLKSCIEVLSKRVGILALLNMVFFGGIFVSLVLLQLLVPPPLFGEWVPWAAKLFLGNWALMIVSIFGINLALSAFTVVTLPGIVFFPLSVVALAYRAFLWGLLLFGVPNWLFLAALPVVVLEGEAYVVAAGAGVIAGISWVKLRWGFGKEEMSRKEALKRGLREALRFYVVASGLLFAASVIETIIVLSMGH